MSNELVIRNMSRPEVDELVSWAACEGWNPGLHDADVFWATDPDAFIAAELEGELIGGGAVTSYAGEFGFMGFFIVRPEFRSRGFGTTLWNARRERLLSASVDPCPHSRIRRVACHARIDDRARATFPEDLRGHALRDLADEPAIAVQQLALGLTLNVDEAGSDDMVARIDADAGRCIGQQSRGRDPGDAVTLQGEVAAEPGGPGAIDDAAVGDDDVVFTAARRGRAGRAGAGATRGDERDQNGDTAGRVRASHE
jgi:GNAT superfamily N-acetyltransferase